MDIKSVKYLISGTQLSHLPKPNLPEYAFVGRSNVGKSSLINRLTNHSGLARVSSTPGKTQTINHFIVNEEVEADTWYLVDLPGYGYAKVSKKQRSGFSKMIKEYIKYRKNLMSLFVLVDSRLKPQEIDLEFMEMLGKQGIPFVMVFTKSDKLNQSERHKNFDAYKKKMYETWEELPPIVISSSVNGRGMDEILKYIGETNKVWKQSQLG